MPKLFNAVGFDWGVIRRHYRATQKLKYFYSAGFGLIHDNIYLAYMDYLGDLRVETKVQWVKSRSMREECRKAVAEFIDSNPEDIGFVSNTSHGMNLLAMMLAQKPKGDTVITSVDDFPATVIPWKYHGFKVKALTSKKGVLTVEDILKSVNKKTAAVVISHVQFITGYRLDIIRLGEELADRKIPFFVNATQSFGAFPFSVRKAKISGLTASCHKWLAAGYAGSVFYVSPEFRKKRKWPLVGWFSVEEPLLMKNFGWRITNQVAAVETGVVPFAPIAAIFEALTIVKEIGIDKIAQRILNLTDYLFEKLSPYRDLLVTSRDYGFSPSASINSGIVSLKISNADEVVAKLLKRNIVTSSPRGFLRFAVHHYNHKKDIDALVQALQGIDLKV